MYLRLTLDHTLSFHEHLRKTAAKVSTRNNLLGMLAGTSWGASAPTLRTSALALCYSVEEYCAPVWSRSPYTRLVDVQLNEAMCTVSGTLRPTPLLWLPVLSHIAPLHLRRKEATTKLLANSNSLLHRLCTSTLHASSLVEFYLTQTANKVDLYYFQYRLQFVVTVSWAAGRASCHV